MASADGFTRYDLVADRDHGKSVVEKHRQRLVNERRAVRSAVRSQILGAEGKSHPTVFVGKTPEQLHHELAQSAAAADDVAVKTVDKLLGESSASGGADPRVHHLKIKSAKTIDKEIKKAQKKIEAAREQLIERGDPLKYVQIPHIAKLGSSATEAERTAYVTAVKDANALLKLKDASAADFKHRRAPRGVQASKSGQEAISKLLLETEHPELLGLTSQAERDALDEHKRAARKIVHRAIEEAAIEGNKSVLNRAADFTPQDHDTRRLIRDVEAMTPFTRKLAGKQALDDINAILAPTPVKSKEPVRLTELLDMNFISDLDYENTQLALEESKRLQSSLWDDIVILQQKHRSTKEAKAKLDAVSENISYLKVHEKHLLKSYHKMMTPRPNSTTPLRQGLTAADFEDAGMGYPSRKRAVAAWFGPTLKTQAKKRK